MPWVPAGPPEDADENDELQARDVLDIGYLALDVLRSLQCRNCDPACPPNPQQHRWSYMRVEAEGTGTLSPEASSEFRVKFECLKCESIHMAFPLSAKGLVTAEDVESHGGGRRVGR